MPETFYSVVYDIRKLLRELLRALSASGKRRASATLSGPGIVAVTTLEGDIMAVVVKTGGPLKFDVSDFVSDKGNPVTSTDPAVYSSSNEAVATVVNDPDDAQDGIITLTGQTTPEGETAVIKATFSPKYGTPFEVVGNLTVIEEIAVSAQAKISGPGVVDGA